MKILGIETSCDETAMAILTDKKEILANQLHSQIAAHRSFGGVVPEIAARNHLLRIEDLFQQTLHEANLNLSEIYHIAVTKGPGLMGCLLVGVGFARSLALFAKKPIIPVNHLEGHLLTVRMTHNVDFPYLCLLLSGGHCQMIWVENFRKYQILGGTIDDSIGECFDKVARMMNLPYPGGPEIEKNAEFGDENRFYFTRVMCTANRLEFSFSGLKTAVKREIEKLNDELDQQDIYDLCASFQKCVQGILAYKLSAAIKKIKYKLGFFDFAIVAGGGVVANKAICEQINQIASENDCDCFFPDKKFCTDNAAMIAWTGIEMLQHRVDFTDDDWRPRAKWSVKDLNN